MAQTHFLGFGMGKKESSEANGHSLQQNMQLQGLFEVD
jgi:hypothetical protein